MTKLLLHWEKNFFSLAEFFRNKNGSWTLGRGATCPLLQEGAESLREEATVQQIQQVLDAWGVRNATLHCFLPADRVFLRTVRIEVPSGLDEAIFTLVKLEAKKTFPSPLEELIWNFQLFPSFEQESINVVYAATKIKFLTPLLKIISKTNLELKTISAVPCALCNAFQLADQGQEACLLIDISTSVINVVLIESNKILSSYTLAFSDSAQVDTTQLITVTLKKIGDDICQILEYAASQKIVPRQILLSGRILLKNQLLSFLQKILKIPTRDLDQLLKNHLSTTSEEAVTFLNNEHPYSWSLLIGGISIVQEESPELNLLPPSLLAEQYSQRQRPYLLGAIALLIFTLLLWSLYFHRETHRLITATAQAVDFLEQEEKKLTESDKALADVQKVQEQKTALCNLIEAHAAWPELIQELQQALPPRYLWITKLSLISDDKNNGKDLSQQKNKNPVSQLNNSMLMEESNHANSSITMIAIEGLYLENPRQDAVVNDFFQRLKKSDFFAIKNQEEACLFHSPPTGTAYAYPFKLLLPLRNPVISSI